MTEYFIIVQDIFLTINSEPKRCVRWLGHSCTSSTLYSGLREIIKRGRGGGGDEGEGETEKREESHARKIWNVQREGMHQFKENSYMI